jgi:hypothetical protein
LVNIFEDCFTRSSNVCFSLNWLVIVDLVWLLELENIFDFAWLLDFLIIYYYLVGGDIYYKYKNSLILFILLFILYYSCKLLSRKIII